MNTEEIRKRAAAWGKRAGRYKYMLIAVVVGLLILLWPESTPEANAAETAGGQSVTAEELEEKLERILGQIEGAGSVSVALTMRSGTEYVFAQDSELRNDSESSEIVVVSSGSGKQEAVIQTQIYPTFRGAVVVCEGGDDPEVKLLITQAVAALTGLSSGRITVCKGT